MLKVVLLLLKRKGKTGLPLLNQLGSQAKLSLEDVPCDRIDFAEILVASQFSEPFHGYCIAGLFAGVNLLKYRFWWRKPAIQYMCVCHSAKMVEGFAHNGCQLRSCVMPFTIVHEILNPGLPLTQS